MSLADERWAQLAEEHEFGQLDGVRKQAEAWRTGLTGLTALLAVVTIIKGPASIAELHPVARWAVAILSLGALAALVYASLRVVQGAAGDPGDSIYLTGEGLRAWTFAEVASVQKDIAAARNAMVAGLAMLGLGLGVTWLAPAADAPPTIPTIIVDSGGAKTCGRLVGIDGTSVMVADPAKPSAPPRIVQLGPGVRAEPTAKC